MREVCSTSPSHLTPWRHERRMTERRRGLFASVGPRRGRRLQHAAEQAFQRPLAQQHRIVIAQRHKGDPPPCRTLGLCVAIGQNPRQASRMTLAA